MRIDYLSPRGDLSGKNFPRHRMGWIFNFRINFDANYISNCSLLQEGWYLTQQKSSLSSHQKCTKRWQENYGGEIFFHELKVFGAATTDLAPFCWREWWNLSYLVTNLPNQVYSLVRSCALKQCFYLLVVPEAATGVTRAVISNGNSRFISSLALASNVGKTVCLLSEHRISLLKVCCRFAEIHCYEWKIWSSCWTLSKGLWLCRHSF